MGMLSDIERCHVNDISVKATDEEKQKNRELCEAYPFLIPHNAFSGKSILDCRGADGEEGYWPGDPADHPEYDYEYTLLDDMPEGWRLAFGEQLCNEIMDELIDKDKVEKYGVDQIKEKYGYLCWYDHNSTEKILGEILPKYEDMSIKTCICCGKPAKYISTGWISPWCDDCARSTDWHTKHIPIDIWLSGKVRDEDFVWLDGDRDGEES